MKNSISPDNLILFCELMGCSVPVGRKTIEEMEPALRQRIFLALKTQEHDEDVILIDPIEQDSVFGTLINQARQQAESETDYSGIGRCHLIWSRQAEILKDEHGIDWYSPAEMNPWVMFD